MCFIVRGREPKRRLATKDIKVKKIFRIKPNNEISSPIKDMTWKRGKVYKSKLDQPHLVELDRNIWRIERGFHSVKKRFYIKKEYGMFYVYFNFLDWLLNGCRLMLVDNGPITVENCIIPKGSYYYRDWWTGQIVSDHLILCQKD